MWTFSEQISDLLERGNLHYFLLFYAYVTALWVIKRYVARSYRPFVLESGKNLSVLQTSPQGLALDHPDRTQVEVPVEVTVVIPVVNERPEDFQRVLLRLINNRPKVRFEIIAVINGPRNEALERVCAEAEAKYRYPITRIWNAEPSKRMAIILGLQASSPEGILVLSDSDTQCLRGHDDCDPARAVNNTLEELLIPFADPKVGGVTTHQSIRFPTGKRRTILAIFANWMEHQRAGKGGTMRGMSVHGTVGCLPGRMIAVRKSIVRRHIEEFLGLFDEGRFMGRHMRESDDRRLTDFCLIDGFDTVFQSTSRVQTDAPETWKQMANQQIRWGRGSQYSTLRMLPFYLLGNKDLSWKVSWHDLRNRQWWQNWRKHTKRMWYLTLVYVTDIITPFWWLGTVINTVWKTAMRGPLYYKPIPLWQQLGLVTGGVLLSAAIRSAGHLRRQPWDIVLLPLYVVLLSFFLTPIRIVAFFQMCHRAGWGTRKDANAAEQTEWNAWMLFPPALGTLLVNLFASLGPLLETRQLFFRFVAEQWPGILVINFLMFTALWWWLPFWKLMTWPIRAPHRYFTRLRLKYQEAEEIPVELPPPLLGHHDEPGRDLPE